MGGTPSCSQLGQMGGEEWRGVGVGGHRRVLWVLNRWVVNANGLVWMGLVSRVLFPMRSILESGQARWVGQRAHPRLE